MTDDKLRRRLTGRAREGRTNAVPMSEEELQDEELDVAPPAYGEHHDQLQFSQAGFNADAAVTTEGRVHIHINEKNHRLSELLAPTLQRQQQQLHTEPASGPLPPAYIPPSLGGQPGQTPPPKLNVVIQIVGSRGDVQPFVALGQVLRDTYGHRVRIATHATFRKFVEDNGLEFFNIGGDPAQLMAFMVKNPGLMPGLDTLKSGDIKRRRQEIQEILMGCWRSCIEAGDGMGVAPPQHKKDEPVDERFVLPGAPGVRPFVADAIIANPPSFAHIHVAEKLGIPLHMMFTMPWTPTRAFPHPLADVVAANTDAAITNYVSYALVEMMTWQGLGDVINRFRVSVLELEYISLLWAPGLLNRLRIPATYCWSPALTPKPADWTPEITVSGFFFLNLESNYTPEPDLAAFLAAGPPPVYIGFGSIVVDDPDGLTQTIFDAVIRSGVRAIVSKGWGGFGSAGGDIPEGVFMLGNCPHDWLFKRVSAVVHHGGAGTTAAGILAGRATIVVPFFGDQIFWGSMVAKAGAGPAPIPYKKLTADNLAEAIQYALLPETQARAAELGGRIQQEQGADVGGKSFHQFLNTDMMRCSLAPSRVAVWRVRRSQVRLSALAATVLVREGWLKYSDLKLYRPVEYHTEEQPWDPVSAVISAVVGDVGALTMTVADFPREVFKKRKGKEGKEEGKGKEKEEGGKGQADDTSTMPELVGSQPSPSIVDPSTALSSHPPQSSSSSANTPSTLSGTPTPPASHAEPGQAPPGPAPANNQSPAPAQPEDSSATAENIDMALAAGRGVGRIVGAGFKVYTNTCLGLARGFRNAPKLYNDDTVRPPEKVTGLVSGMRIAGKELGLGLYDGTSGLFTQPWRGAEKEGGVGFVKGVGKGVGGFFFKNAAAIFAVPAYTMQGIRVGVRGLFARSMMNYVVTSRVVQGEEDFEAASGRERGDVLVRWGSVREELKGFYLFKQKQKQKGKAAEGQEEGRDGGGPGGVEYPEGNGSGHKVARLNLPWTRRRASSGSAVSPGLVSPSLASPSTTTSSTTNTSTFRPTTASTTSASSVFSAAEDHESLERAIQQSVAQTSTGDAEEDARVEAAVRASVMEMRRAAELQPSQQTGTGAGTARGVERNAAGWIIDQKTAQPDVPGPATMTDEQWTNISDEEYQALIEEAVRQSLLVQQQQAEEEAQMQRDGLAEFDNAKYRFGGPASGSGSGSAQEEGVQSPTRPATHATPTSPSGQAGGNEGRNEEEEEDEETQQLRLAIAESAREHRTLTEAAERQRTEEEIVLEYVKKQSLAEEEFRRAKRASTLPASQGNGKGKGVDVNVGEGEGEGTGQQEEEEDEELRRAIEESLRMSGGGDGGPSRV
ncbi:glycosyltransferase [Dichotomopilus funicola]|uniref:Glycosyltransferase n=1 Tax=Dichotomopilus funicola TaxID=1934379 RepID=A0AAN6ZJW2_9PEZI|nr:glycosyltransferase [Dichotomopilus funicola]